MQRAKQKKWLLSIASVVTLFIVLITWPVYVSLVQATIGVNNELLGLRPMMNPIDLQIDQLDEPADDSLYGWQQQLQMKAKMLWTANGEMNDIEDTLNVPLGVVRIIENDSNIRTYADATDDYNIAFVANVGAEYLVTDVTSYGDREWYEILAHETGNSDVMFTPYYVSSAVSEPSITGLADDVEDEVTSFIDELFEARKQMLETQDRTQMEQFVAQGANVYPNDEMLMNEQFQMQKIDVINIVADDATRVLVQTIECYMTIEAGEVVPLYIVNHYLLERQNDTYIIAKNLNIALINSYSY